MFRSGSLLACAVLLAACSGGEAPPSVLLVTVDTLRADALGVYGAVPSPSPSLDALASESRLFEQAISPMPMTRPAHFSLFTSRYPREHGVVNNRLALPASEETLAEVLRSRGYRTGAFVGVRLLSKNSGAGQGFETLEPPAEKQRSARDVVASALAWLDGLGASEPFFAWVHLFDPHQPYEQKDPALGDVDPRLLAEFPKLEWPELYRIAEENGGDIPRAVLDHALAMYRSEVAYADREIGRLLDGVRALRDLDDVIVIVTADHGECFEDGVFFEHSDCLHQAALRVPLLVRHPASFEPGSRSDSIVSLVDLGPTVLEAAGFGSPSSFGGIPLQREGQDGARRQVLVQHPFFQQEAIDRRLKKRAAIESVAGMPAAPVVVAEEKLGLVDARWKYLRTPSKQELFRLGAGSDESGDVAADEGAVVSERSQALDALLERHPLVVLDSGEINDELRATLEALGYVQ